MRRIVLAFALTVGLAIGTVVPASALDTSVTLNCSDGTSVKLVVDANTLTGLTQAVQAMIDYPAGLSCTLIQNPLGVTFGQIASASTGSNPFIVGGGRWQATVLCSDLQLTPPPPPPALVGGSTVARVPGSWSYDPNAYPSSQQTEATTMIWVNIAVNVHQMDGGTGPFFGTLNETIPTQQSTACGGTVTERHFTSTPTCLQTSLGPPLSAAVTSLVTQISGDPFPHATALGQSINFSFIDNGNPGDGNPPDTLQGPPEPANSACSLPPATPPDGTLVNGNISIRNPSS